MEQSWEKRALSLWYNRGTNQKGGLYFSGFLSGKAEFKKGKIGK